MIAVRKEKRKQQLRQLKKRKTRKRRRLKKPEKPKWQFVILASLKVLATILKELRDPDRNMHNFDPGANHFSLPPFLPFEEKQ